MQDFIAILASNFEVAVMLIGLGGGGIIGLIAHSIYKDL